MRNTTSIIETLTNSEVYSLQDAQDKITLELLKSLDCGDEIELNNDYTLYRYLEDECIVIVLTEEWEEVLQVMYDENKIIFEAL